MMSKRVFNALATGLKKVEPLPKEKAQHDQWLSCRAVIVEVCLNDNPRFNVERFLIESTNRPGKTGKV